MGSKKLKAIAVVGNKSVPVADPWEMMDARMWLRNRINTEPDNVGSAVNSPSPGLGYSPGWGADNQGRPMSCYGCDQGCRQNPAGTSEDGFPLASGLQCVDNYIGQREDSALHGRSTEYTVYANTFCQRHGLNDFEMSSMLSQRVSAQTLAARGGVGWLRNCWDRGIIGPIGSGKRIETDLDFSQEYTKDFVLELMRQIACADSELGRDVAMGQVRCAEKWGILEDDMMSGAMNMIYWGGETHWGIYPGMAYVGLFQVRDPNWHMHNNIDQGAVATLTATGTALETALKRIKTKTESVTQLAHPWHDYMMFDQSEKGTYSLGMARYVAFTQYMAKFWRDCAMTCDQNNVWKNWQHDMGNSDPDQASGMMPDFFTRFFNATTGLNWSWEDGLDMGKKVWDFERAILALHGRHRNEEYFPPYPPYDSYVYHPGQPYLQTAASGGSPTNPQVETVWDPKLYGGKGGYTDAITEFPLSKAKMDEFKTIYYGVEGWDPKTGRPTRKGLEAQGLGYVADVLESKGRLGGTRSGSTTSPITASFGDKKLGSGDSVKLGESVELSGTLQAYNPVGQNVLVYMQRPERTYWEWVGTCRATQAGNEGAWRYNHTFTKKDFGHTRMKGERENYKNIEKGAYQFKVVFLDAESPAVEIKVV
ncbi:MAG: hypothetical protein FWE94_05155, partial [Coriobacteriia bacterium]|nr:hypothetical protein [Coriobacteriia bacterium]